MNELQKKYLALLLEIDEFCKCNRIRYFLDPETTAKAILYKHFQNENDTYIGLLMDIENGMKFINEFYKGDVPFERSIETMLNSKTYDEFAILYVDEASTYIELGKNISNEKLGLRIKINFIRKAKKNYIYSFIERGWEYHDFDFRGDYRIRNMISSLIIRLGTVILGKKYVSKHIFLSLSKYYASTSESRKCFIKEKKGKRVYLNSNIFHKEQYVEFEGYKFPIPNLTNYYLNKTIGSNWKKRRPKYRKQNNVIVIADVPYRCYLKKIGGIKCLATFFREKKVYRISKIFINKEMKEKQKTWIIAKRSGERLELYESLMERKDEIDLLYEEQNYKALSKIFSKYHKRAKFYLKYNLCLCPSEELLTILCEILDYKGEYKTAIELLNLMPEEHRRPLMKIGETKHEN